MLPTSEEQDKKLVELQKYYPLQPTILAKEYAKWYAEQVIRHCAEVATTKIGWTGSEMVNEDSILNVINEIQ